MCSDSCDSCDSSDSSESSDSSDSSDCNDQKTFFFHTKKLQKLFHNVLAQ